MFVKGKSGNPLGRPKDPFGALIRAKSKDAKVLVDKAFTLLDSEDEDIQIKALHWLSDRGWGKPAQAVELSGKDGGPITVTCVKYA